MSVILKIKDKEVESTKITYDDLIELYKQYIETYGEVPVYAKCDKKHNMPQGRIITRVLKENDVTYNDFLLQFGKVAHVRSEIKNYDLYVKRFKEISDEIGHALCGNELLNNKYGLPNPNWFVKYCPDKNVKSYDDFVIWCGYESNKLKKDKELIVATLTNLEKELGRPIIREDISYEKTGFSMIVINRMFGGLNKAKEEIGLLPTPLDTPLHPFEYYKKTLLEAINNLYAQTGRKFFTWQDLESGLYHKNNIEHKSMTKAFKREGLDIFAYIKNLGYEMNPNGFSFKHTFDDGERVVSTMEYDFSNYIRSIGYKYNESYFRDVMYKNFTNLDKSRKTNCDYCIVLENGQNLYVEIAGMIHNPNNSWKEIKYTYLKHKEYQEKMIFKENLLISNKCNYLFLFPEDMQDKKYIKLINDKIMEIVNSKKKQCDVTHGSFLIDKGEFNESNIT